MALINYDDDLMDDLISSEDYEVIPRPTELIELQKRLSSSKSKHTTDKSGSGPSKRSSEKKSKEKRSSNKRERKGSSKAKPLYKPPIPESSLKKYVASELDSRFESFIQNAKTSIYKHKSDAAKIVGNESSDLPGTKNKLSDLDTNKYLDIQPSKIMDEPAVTDLERYKVLDARDAAMRSRDTKQGDSKKTKITGTCPDMCPEKERYSRITKNCLSIMEMTTALNQNATSRDANHRYMVKEYSRSSADQQEPLPHELRPISVLMFTMDYLICNIMDISLDNISLADWYDFIWNRTRSIRKDITQQQLCDIQCVEIIEKCVRFHIHCAEALSEEEAATFDPKINNENLTKCLQTLKHMYHDLQSKGIQCPNEAEFRSYDILLSLTEGETLRLIKDIRNDLLRSPLIKFAFNAALAFKSHNYVKFFKLIEKANYLSSCILHRYILEARVRALQIIVRAYSTPQISSLYPIASLVKDLKFENLSEATEFCRCHGLEADDTYITIERKLFSRTASALTTSRSFQLVGCKRGESLGKIINKGELPANPLSWYQPHDSFDEKNILKINSLGSVTKTDAELPRESLPPPVTASSIFTKPLAPTSAPAFPTLSSDTKAFFSTPTPSVSPSSRNFNFFNKGNDPFTSTSKEHSFLRSDSPFNRKALNLPATEEFFSLGSKPSRPSGLWTMLQSHISKENEVSSNSQLSAPPETEIEYPDAENVIMAEVFESSNEAIMEEAVEMNEESASSMKINMSDCSSQPVFNRNELEFDKREEGFRGLPTSGIPSPRPVFSTYVPHFPGAEKILSARIKSSPLITFGAGVHNFPRSEKVLSPRKSSVQSEKGTEYQGNDAEDKISLIDLAEDSNSSIEIEMEVDEINEEEREEIELNKTIEGLFEELFSECIQEYLVSICKDVLNDARNEKAKLKDELETIRTSLALKTILKWKYFCERRRQRRVFENSTLCSPWQAMLLNTPYIATGVVSPMVVYKKHCFLSRLTAANIQKRKEITPGWEEFKNEHIWSLKDFRPYPSAYFGKSGIKFFFKLCIVFPSDCISFDVTTFMNWICAKFSLEKTQNFEFDAMKTYLLHNGRTLVSVRALQLGPHSRSNYVKFLDGITAMILFVPPSSESNGFYEDFTSLLDSDSLQYPYPLFVYILESRQKSARLITYLHEKLDARYFTELKTECLLEMKHFRENSSKVLEALNWLLAMEKKYFSHPWLHKCSFANYLEDSFTVAFNILLCKMSLDEFKCLKQMPKHIINFYNKVLQFRSSILCSDLLERIQSCWPPEEIKLHADKKFINIETQKEFQRKMESLLLPVLEGESIHNCNISDYVTRVADFACRDQDMLFIRVKNALNSSPDDWLMIIYLCALHLIHAQNLELSSSSEDFPVYYTKEDVENFDCDEFWVEVLSDIRSASTLNCSKRKKDSASVSPIKKKKWELNDEEVFTYTLNETPLEVKNFISNAFDMPDILSCQRENLFAPLRAALAKQAEQSDAFIHRLNESVQNIDGIPTVTLDEEKFLEEKNFSSDGIPFDTNIDSFDSPFQSRLNLNAQLNSGVDLLSVSIPDSSRNSLSSIADKISELKYNIQKSSILEDHFGQLLAKQL